MPYIAVGFSIFQETSVTLCILEHLYSFPDPKVLLRWTRNNLGLQLILLLTKVSILSDLDGRLI